MKNQSESYSNVLKKQLPDSINILNQLPLKTMPALFDYTLYIMIPV
jgi:hypothetical protein